MFVLTSVIVTVTPGSANPDGSTILPTRPPLTAWASATRAHSRTSAAADRHTTRARLEKRSMSQSSLVLQDAQCTPDDERERRAANDERLLSGAVLRQFPD